METAVVFFLVVDNRFKGFVLWLINSNSLTYALKIVYPYITLYDLI